MSSSASFAKDIVVFEIALGDFEHGCVASRADLQASDVGTAERRIVNLTDSERLLPTPLGLSGQHNRRPKEFPHLSCRATDTTSIPRPLKLTTPLFWLCGELSEG